MRRLVIYWEQDSSDLLLIPDDIGTMTVGNDGMEVIVGDYGATRIKEIVEDNPDRLILDTDEPATSRHVAAAMEWYDRARLPGPGEETNFQDVLRVLGIDDAHEIEHIIETELTNEDCRAWHESELTENAKYLVDVFGPFQVWGTKNPQAGEEPLSVIWPA